MYKLINLEKRIADLNLDINLVLQATQISDKIYNEQKKGVGSLSKDEINRLADYLDCTPEYLMGKSDIPFPEESVFVRTPVKIEEHNRLIKDGYKPIGKCGWKDPLETVIYRKKHNKKAISFASRDGGIEETDISPSTVQETIEKLPTIEQEINPLDED